MWISCGRLCPARPQYQEWAARFNWQIEAKFPERTGTTDRRVLPAAGMLSQASTR